jgi:hypothetical protein
MVLFVTLNGLLAAGAGEITLAGTKLTAYLDGLEVEKLWLPGKYVQWEDGKSSDEPIKGVGKQTHCSAFVAAACARREVYILRPPEHAQIRLANAQAGWLRREGGKHGWKPVQSAWEAQQYANKGDLVVAAYKETGAKTVKGKVVPRPGHIALVRPSTRGKASVAKDGPQIIQAGGTNANSTTLKKGFSHHPNAWGKHQVRFYRHELTWK